MGSRALLLLKVALPLKHQIKCLNYTKITPASELLTKRRFSIKATNGSSLQPPDVSRLAETARISLNQNEVEEFAPKIRQVIDWFGQLQAVDLNSVEPAIRADSEGENLRDDVPETFSEREAIIAAVPSYEKPYVKVPKVLNKE
ncbi:glutamyl-tRNA(Gln) amidotransferase subunit C, chloroplastic/mitochondrial [Ricinus communis]|uniref:Glutamyl-tRNA(Gln) amidotransferase subunit C, chloroplastic/mitochondrial n=1 Tax=Ricinus communis TaxID=3988 RepID=GATC_RICCO|nr:glutamyl-tRNA(Gln) amidotransferase subunit C, chloroplastic/mitochondrial [Ricinus communis]B9RRX2.1 RecName: Full=Glutamyl-tRNA(Gln) amidotransferase subunit C, chloroplastic/mitochondrial; Short=Glu-AdT subunit C [Ricinus communis]EEF45832.1 Glutamyl-tRNA(Gln) amidotransferase subunit C, putative [Ricinus communis]|eukprot:XP_002516491.1 glutamyl-tRNA(Gln) amidotransferase subunit C, chloroplastic/mitochondrial [Ricinus communis]